MEREGNVANLALFLKLEGLLHKFERNDLLVKGLLIDTPEMIEIDIVGIKLCKALVESCLEVLRAVDKLEWTLCGNVDLVTDWLEGLTNGDLTVAVAIVESCVEVIDTKLIGLHEHLVGLLLIHLPGTVLKLILRKSHTSKTESRNIYTCVSEFTILHNNSP